ncbi:PREDICTED: transcription factor grauzone-like isoform X2 [Rhagoletis zephyria]|uniref:transcription factor grauzone-like isoform X2 n=1 Tax=Rhagoletis zephyria TaxID=28612 RepID=UPI0008116524|nr:PREDICTED: transcription factor grauzone-like isoform X2 [Rhagoletis zephyria]
MYGNNMICRLCLVESKDILNIYTETGEMARKEVLKVVAQHFQIEIRYDDTVSNVICSVCWNQLHVFHKFWLSIEEKQKNLKSHLHLPEIKHDIEDVEAKPYDEMPISHEKVDTGLCEPEIDIFFGKFGVYGGQTEFVAAKTEEDESTMGDDYFSIPLMDSLDIHSKDNKCEAQKLNVVVENKGKARRGRPKKIDSPSKKNKTDIKEKPERRKRTANKKKTQSKDIAQKPEHSINYGEKLKAIQKADEFLAKNTELDCFICKEKLKDFKDLKTHFRQKHKCAGYAVCCDQRFLKRTLFVDHIQLHKNPDFFKCSICQKQLISRKNYINHMHSLHPAAENLQFACKLCPKKFIKQYILDSHIKMCHMSKNHVCKLCDKAFANIWTLTQHERAVHRNEFESVCEICGKRLRTTANLKYHMDNIHNTEPRPEEHEATHTGVDLYTCSFCPKTFRSNANMHKHKIHSHSDEWVRKYAQPNEYTLSVLNKTHNIEAQPGIPTNLND